MSIPAELYGLVRTATGLRAFARHIVTPEEARARVVERMRTREARFLRTLSRVVYARPRNPYAQLLRHAGIEEADVRGLVEHDGLEAALATLARAGVSVNWEEFKGRTPAVRGSRTFHFEQGDFDNPLTKTFYTALSGGSSGPAVRVNVDLEFQAEAAPNWGVWFDAQGWAHRPLVFWTPTHTGLANRYLMCLKLGYRYERWFAMTDVRAIADRVRSKAIHRLCQRVLGLARAEPAGLNETERVLIGLLRIVDEGRLPLVNTSPSAAARLSQLALDRGRSLEGVSFLLGAEPVTPERKASIEASGARSCPTYGTSETGWVGAQFPGATEHDEIHVFRDSYAVIPAAQDDDASGGPRAMLFTTLIEAAPKVLLNAEIGDSACLRHVPASAAARDYGYDLTMHTIRSFRKLTAFGVTFAVADLYPVIEDVLPARFGGRTGDYQLVEGQDAAGISHLQLIVDPRVDDIDEVALRRTLLDEMGRRRNHYQFMAGMLDKAGAITIARGVLRSTAAGKVLPVMPAPSRTDRSA